jgi:hypothetical protein
MLADLITARMKAIETNDLETRLAELERAAGNVASATGTDDSDRAAPLVASRRWARTASRG